MKNLDNTSSRFKPRPPARRLDTQTMPWSISVAETPHSDSRSFSIYIKTPMHNLTLTRTATELFHLHAQLEDSDGANNLPNFPLDITSLASHPAKRKAPFLNVLSGLASSYMNVVGQSSARAPTNPNFGSSTTDQSTVPESQEISGTSISLSSSSTGIVSERGTGITHLATYLNIIANESSLRHTRPWRRFIHVRTDDLQSSLPKMPINHVQSYVAAHDKKGAVEEEKTTLPTPIADVSPSTNLTDPNRKRTAQEGVSITDFELMRVLGKGSVAKVLLVRHKNNSNLYALKAIKKRHVLAHQELQHTLTEQAILKHMATEAKVPFVVKLWWSFHDEENLFLVLDFHPGGDLATQLARWGKLGRDRTRFYAAEIVEGVEALHAAGVIYRDIRPENILIGADGHIVLTDFGLSKEFPRRTTAPPTSSGTSEHTTPLWMNGEKSQEGSTARGGTDPADTTSTFCGTAEYVAPEVLQGIPYSYEVDWWSFGTMLYEMLTGRTPFWAENHSDMYVRILQDELKFPEDMAMDQDAKSLIRTLLQRNPASRIREPRIKQHPYFFMIDWSHVYAKRYKPPYIPPMDPSNASDTQNFDDTFLDMEPLLDGPDDQDQTDCGAAGSEDISPTSSHSRSPLESVPDENTIDVFNSYSFNDRHSVIMDDEDDDSSGDSVEEGTDEDVIPSVFDYVSGPPSHPASESDSEIPVSDEAKAEPKTPEVQGTSLSALGVVDRYKLSVFRNASKPRHTFPSLAHNSSRPIASLSSTTESPFGPWRSSGSQSSLGDRNQSSDESNRSRSSSHASSASGASFDSQSSGFRVRSEHRVNSAAIPGPDTLDTPSSPQAPKYSSHQ